MVAIVVNKKNYHPLETVLISSSTNTMKMRQSYVEHKLIILFKFYFCFFNSYFLKFEASLFVYSLSEKCSMCLESC